MAEIKCDDCNGTGKVDNGRTKICPYCIGHPGLWNPNYTKPCNYCEAGKIKVRDFCNYCEGEGSISTNNKQSRYGKYKVRLNY